MCDILLLSLVLPLNDLWCYPTMKCATIDLRSFRTVVMNQDNDRSNNVPPRSTDNSHALGQRVYDTARVQRTPQIIRDRLDQGLSPAAGAGVAAIIAIIDGITIASPNANDINYLRVSWIPTIHDVPRWSVARP